MTVRKLHPAPPEKTREKVGEKARLEVVEGGADDLLQFGAVGKALLVLESLTADRRPLTMTELSRATGMTKPTAHRIVTLLDELGFVEREPSGRGYVEGPRLIKLALNTLSASAPRAMRRAVLRAVSEDVGETCNLGILFGGEVVYIDRVEAKWPLGLRFEAGSRVPAHCTAIGKLLLSLLPEDELAARLRTMPLTRYTANTITDADRLLENLAAIRGEGVGTDDQEFMSGVVCVAVPVAAKGGRVIGGIAVSAPEARMTMDQARGFVPLMRRAARKVGETFKLDKTD
jgi:IclR family acetate operon transcriptional repressor